MIDERWDYATLARCWAVWPTEGDDGMQPPCAIFDDEAEATRYADALRKHPDEDERRPNAMVLECRNVEVPYWNSTDDVPADEPAPPPTWDERDHRDTLARAEATASRCLGAADIALLVLREAAPLVGGSQDAARIMRMIERVEYAINNAVRKSSR